MAIEFFMVTLTEMTTSAKYGMSSETRRTSVRLAKIRKLVIPAKLGQYAIRDRQCSSGQSQEHSLIKHYRLR